jgi:hypothetical protein
MEPSWAAGAESVGSKIVNNWWPSVGMHTASVIFV